jgi:hypothetical protein
MKPPVVIIGCHRSGTSLLTEIIGRFGIFTGYKVSGHNESLFFVRANQYIYNIAHGRWDNPTPVNNLIRALKKDPILNDQFLTFFRERLLSQIYGEYWGGAKERPCWGWKDPRNSFTLPIWKEIYPEMKIIHVYRNGVDVAASFQVREMSRGGKFNNHIFSYRCLELAGGFSLWSEYVTQCRNVLKSIPADHRLEIQYENLLHDPGGEFLRLENFLKVPTEKIRDILTVLAENVDPNNAYKFVNNDGLKDFYREIKAHPLMETLGYDGII